MNVLLASLEDIANQIGDLSAEQHQQFVDKVAKAMKIDPVFFANAGSVIHLLRTAAEKQAEELTVRPTKCVDVDLAPFQSLC